MANWTSISLKEIKSRVQQPQSPRSDVSLEENKDSDILSTRKDHDGLSLFCTIILLLCFIFFFIAHAHTTKFFTSEPILYRGLSAVLPAKLPFDTGDFSEESVLPANLPFDSVNSSEESVLPANLPFDSVNSIEESNMSSKSNSTGDPMELYKDLPSKESDHMPSKNIQKKKKKKYKKSQKYRNHTTNGDPVELYNDIVEMSKVLDIYVISDRKKGRAGHQLKDTGSALALAIMFGWNYVVLPDTFKLVKEIIDLDKVTLERQCYRKKDSIDLLGRKDFARTFGNWASFEDFIRHMHKRFRAYKKRYFKAGKWRPGPKLCVDLKMNWRVHWPQMYEWESFGYLPKGTYMKAINKLQEGFYYDPAKWKRPGTTAVVHFRRGDTKVCCVHTEVIDEVNSDLWDATLDLMDVVAERHNFENCDSCRFQLITEPENSEDVFEKGCARLHEKGVSCEVISTTLLDDFMRMIASDIFIMASSSLSYWAALLGKREHVYALSGIQWPHDVWNGYLMNNVVNTTDMGFQQTCFAYQTDIWPGLQQMPSRKIYEIDCTRDAKKVIIPRKNKLD